MQPQPQQPNMMHQPQQAMNGPAQSGPKFEMKPIATSETKQEQRRTGGRNQTGNGNNFELENLDISPGNKHGVIPIIGLTVCS